MLTQETKATAQLVFAHLISAWYSQHPNMPGDGDLKNFADLAVKAAATLEDKIGR